MKNVKFEKENFLKTPEHFNQIVEQCVQEQLEQENGVILIKEYKSNKKKTGSVFVKVAVAILVLIVVSGGGALAAKYYRLSKIVKEDVGPNNVDVDNEIQIVEEKQSVSESLPSVLEERADLKEKLTSEALITIKEVYFDGSKLYFYSETTDYGEQFVDNMGTDHVYINGELRVSRFSILNPDEYPEFESVKNTVFYNEVQLADMMLTEDFVVEVLCVAFSDSGEMVLSNSVFNVTVDDDSHVYETMRVELEDGHVDIYECSVSSTTTYIKYAYYFTGEHAQERIENLCYSLVILRDDFGNEVNEAYAMNPPNGKPVPSPMQAEDGSWYIVHETYVGGISTETTTLTIIPYYYPPVSDSVETGKPEMGEAMDYGVFTVTLD